MFRYRSGEQCVAGFAEVHVIPEIKRETGVCRRAKTLRADSCYP
jgi:hypothetical protein